MRGRAQPLRQLHKNLLLQPCCVFHLRFLLQRLSQLSKPLLQMNKKCCGAARHNSDVWRGPDDKPCMPKRFFPHFAKKTHGLDHQAKEAMLGPLTQVWFRSDLWSVSVSQAAQPLTEKHLMLDFTELTSREKKKKNCLVKLDVRPKWVEAFPTREQNSWAIVKTLLAEVISRWGIPAKISSGKGARFVNLSIQQVGKQFTENRTG